MNRSAVVVGSGPNGLAAAITLARAGCDVTVYEAETSIGGGVRSSPLTLPGFLHDTCSAVHPMAIASPFFRSLPLQQFGLEWIQPDAPLAHPLDGGGAVMLERSLEQTAGSLERDAPAYQRLFAPLVRDADSLLDAFLAPMFPPRHPLLMSRFGWRALRSAASLARSTFRDASARALFAGVSAHAVLPLESPGSASFGLMLGMMGHAWGWPIPRGGSQSLTNALAGYFTSLGGTIVTDHRITSTQALDSARLVLFDIMPDQLRALAGDTLPSGYARRLSAYRHGAAAFKLDWALRGPIPWRNAQCARAATVHLGGSIDEIARSERAPVQRQHAVAPFVLLTQPSLFDATRAPSGRHTAWAYCHVPNRSTVDMTGHIEAQVERFAPGFGEQILMRHVMTPADIQRRNANYVGGDIVGGSNNLWQLIARPMLRWNPYAVPHKGWFLCSAATPPGGGVHGMSGYHAACSALHSIGVQA